LVVLSNVVYHICAKSLPAAMNPLASLTVTYLVGAAASATLFCLLNKNASLLKEYAHMNWAPVLLGLAVVGLEMGVICAYKAGWPVSTASIVQSSFLAVALIFVGFFLYREAITWSKVVGILICLVGLGFINR
ncbi:MAG: EamA family transporter, partial [Ruminiclostridium sp.]|nr:EamA family transporter [Ruminiclostridium sp.]